MRIPLLMIGIVVVASGAASRAHAWAAGQTPDGKELYDANCKKCHGAIGTPPKTMKTKYPKIATFDSAFIAKHSVDSIVKVLNNGKSEDMKSFKDRFTPDEMTAVANYVQRLGTPKPSN